MGQTIGPLVQDVVAGRFVSEGDGRHLRCCRHHRFERFVQAALLERYARATRFKQGGAFLGRHDRQAVQRQARVRDRRQEQVAVVAEPAANRAGLEQVDIVVALDVQLGARVGNIEPDVEVVSRARRLQALEGQTAEGRRVGHPIDVEDRRGERRVAGVARQVQQLNQSAAGDVAMLVRLDEGSARGDQVTGERFGRIGLSLSGSICARSVRPGARWAASTGQRAECRRRDRFGQPAASAPPATRRERRNVQPACARRGP